MANHPIESLMTTAMENIKQMVEVDTVIGEPVETGDGKVIIPVSSVSAGFAAGGGEYNPGQLGEETKLAFGGGSGAGVSVRPVGFLIAGPDNIRFLPVSNEAIYDRLVDLAPQVMDRIGGMLNKDKHTYNGNGYEPEPSREEVRQQLEIETD